MNDSNSEKYATYRGAGHVPLVLGVPLIPLLVLFGSSIVSFFLFVIILGWTVFGLVICSTFLAIGVWLHFECSFESRALEIRTLEIKGVFLRIKQRAKILEVTSMKQSSNKEVEDVQRFVKEKLGL